MSNSPLRTLVLSLNPSPAWSWRLCPKPSRFGCFSLAPERRAANYHRHEARLPVWSLRLRVTPDCRRDHAKTSTPAVSESRLRGTVLVLASFAGLREPAGSFFAAANFHSFAYKTLSSVCIAQVSKSRTLPEVSPSPLPSAAANRNVNPP